MTIEFWRDWMKLICIYCCCSASRTTSNLRRDISRLICKIGFGSTCYVINCPPKMCHMRLYSVLRRLLVQTSKIALWLYHALTLLGFGLCFYYSGLSYLGRDLVMDEYMEAEGDAAKILIGTMKMLKTGHNIQYNTDTVIFFDTPLTEAICNQCLHRIQRLASPYSSIDIREYWIKNTFYDRSFLGRLQRSLPGIMLMIDGEALGMEVMHGTVSLQDEWVWDEQARIPIHKTDEAFLAMGALGDQLPTLSFEMVLEKVFAASSWTNSVSNRRI